MRTAPALLRASALLLAVSAPTLSARLGETEEDLVKRHGEVTIRDHDQVKVDGKRHKVGEQLSFMTEPYRVRAVLIDGRCERIRYEKTGEWTEEQINSLLALNASEYPWKTAETRYRVARREWVREDGTTATWSSSLSMTFSTPVYAAAVEAAENSAAGDKN
jgi:hypothetical protein